MSIARVQTAFASQDDTGSSPISATWGSPTTAGNLLVAFFSCSSALTTGPGDTLVVAGVLYTASDDAVMVTPDVRRRCERTNLAVMERETRGRVTDKVTGSLAELAAWQTLVVGFHLEESPARAG
jgi:hypothetical protein